MKMTFKEAIDYLIKHNGTECTDNQYYKVTEFISMLPQHPSSFENLYHNKRLNVYYMTLTDYDTQTDYDVRFKHQDSTFYFGVFGESESENPNNYEKAQSNEEAMALLEEYRSVKFASDIDKWHTMSEDPSVGRWARQRDQDARREQIEIAKKL